LLTTFFLLRNTASTEYKQHWVVLDRKQKRLNFCGNGSTLKKL